MKHLGGKNEQKYEIIWKYFAPGFVRTWTLDPL